MTPEQQNIAMANLDGYTVNQLAVVERPNYLSDLNAVARVVKSLPIEKQWLWFARLTEIVTADKPAALGDAEDWTKACLIVTDLWKELTPMPDKPNVELSEQEFLAAGEIAPYPHQAIRKEDCETCLKIARIIAKHTRAPDSEGKMQTAKWWKKRAQDEQAIKEAEKKILLEEIRRRVDAEASLTEWKAKAEQAESLALSLHKQLSDNANMVLVPDERYEELLAAEKELAALRKGLTK